MNVKKYFLIFTLIFLLIALGVVSAADTVNKTAVQKTEITKISKEKINIEKTSKKADTVKTHTKNKTVTAKIDDTSEKLITSGKTIKNEVNKTTDTDKNTDTTDKSNLLTKKNSTKNVKEDDSSTISINYSPINQDKYNGDIITISGKITDDNNDVAGQKITVALYDFYNNFARKDVLIMTTNESGHFKTDYTLHNFVVSDSNEEILVLVYAWYGDQIANTNFFIKNKDGINLNTKIDSSYKYVGQNLSIIGSLVNNNKVVSGADIKLRLYKKELNENTHQEEEIDLITKNIKTNSTGMFSFGCNLDDSFLSSDRFVYYEASYGDEVITSRFTLENIRYNYEVQKENNKLIVNGTLFLEEWGWNFETMNISIYKGNYKKIGYTTSDKILTESTVTENSGKFKFEYDLSDYSVGNYSVVLKFDNRNTVDSKIGDIIEKGETFNVTKSPTVTIKVPEGLAVGEEFEFNVSLTDNDNPITVSLDNIEVTVNGETVTLEYDNDNNIFTGKYTPSTDGSLTFVANFKGEGFYDACEEILKDTQLVPIDVTLDVPEKVAINNPMNIKVGIINKEDNSIVSGKIKVYINNEYYTTITITNTEETITYTPTTETLEIYIEYEENNYVNKIESVLITDIPTTTTITAPESVKVGEEFTFNITVKYKDNIIDISSDELVVKLNDKIVPVEYDSDNNIFTGKYTPTDNTPITITASFNGNNKYFPSKAESVTINDITLISTSVTLDIPENTTKNKPMNITVGLINSKNNTIISGKVKIYINNELYDTITITNTEETITYTPTTETLEIYAEYDGDDKVYYASKTESSTVKVTISTSVTISAPESVKIDEEFTFNITVKNDDNDDVTFDTSNVIVKLNNNAISVTYDSKNKVYTGKYTPADNTPITITASFKGEDKYESSEEESLTISNVEKLSVTLDIINLPKNVTATEKVTFKVKLSGNNDVSGKNIIVKVNDETISGLSKTDNNGEVTVVYTPKNNTDLKIVAELNNDSVYEDKKDQKTISNIALASSALSITVPKTVNVSEELTIIVKLTHNGKAVDGQTVTIKINDLKILSIEKTDANGERTITYVPKDNSTIKISAEFSNDTAFKGSSDSASVNVIGSSSENNTSNNTTDIRNTTNNNTNSSTTNTNNTNTSKNTKLNTNIVIEKVSTLVGKTVTLKATIKDSKGNTVKSGKVLFKINGKIIKDKNSKAKYINVTNGVAKIKYVVPNSWIKNNMKVSVIYYGNSKYNKSSVTKSNIITVNKGKSNLVIIPKTVQGKAGTKITLKINITCAYSQRGLNTKVKVKINGKTFNVNTKKGIGSLTYTIPRGLDAKTYTITATHSSSYRNKSTGTSKLVVEKTTPSIKVTKLSYKSKKFSLKASIKDAVNKLLNKNVKVTVKIDGKTIINKKIVKKGNINLSINKALNKGTHNVTIISGPNNAFNTSKIIKTLKV